MSIIYDALKKVEAISNKNEESKDKEFKPKVTPRVYLIYILIIAIGFLVANMVFNLIIPKDRQISKVVTPDLKESPKVLEKDKATALLQEKSSTQKVENINIPTESVYEETPSSLETQNSPTTDETKELPQPSLILNGVFFSENQGFALINNRILKVGDILDGATVTRITSEGVDLEFNGRSISLSNAAK